MICSLISLLLPSTVIAHVQLESLSLGFLSQGGNGHTIDGRNALGGVAYKNRCVEGEFFFPKAHSSLQPPLQPALLEQEVAIYHK